MLTLFWIAVFFVAFVALAYKRARLVTAAGVIGVLLAVCTATSIGAVTALVLWAVFAGVFGVLLVPGLRQQIARRLVSRVVIMTPAGAGANERYAGRGSGTSSRTPQSVIEGDYERKSTDTRNDENDGRD